MANFAIVIGIDAYTNQAWNLSAAVNDALSFAEWTLNYGGVDEQNLHLLLSASQPPITTHFYLEANRRNITTTILNFQKGAGKGGERLYFYYAGHGVSAPGATRGDSAEPVLIPADALDIHADRALLIGFSAIIPLLMTVEPKEQFFFIDACRDFALEDSQPAIGAIAPWRPVDPERDQKAGERSSQYWLYATSPGGRAAEQPGLMGKGIFAAALMDALRGRAPGAMEWSPRGVYEVRLGRLVPYLTQRIRREIGDEKQWQRFLQAPEYGTRSVDPDPVVTKFRPEDVEKLDVRVRVTPKVARQSCTIRVLLPTPVGDHVVDSKGPPVSLPAEFSLLPGAYAFEAFADHLKSTRELYEVNEAFVVDFELTEATTEAISKGAVATDGTLHVSFRDRAGLIVVRNGEGLIEGQGTGEVRLANLLPGLYRVQVFLPEGMAWSKTIEVRAGEAADVRVDALAMPLGQAQLAMLAARGISRDAEGYLHPSEHLGDIGSTSLAALLGLAAYAAHRPDDGGFEKLRKFGVRSLTDLTEGRAGLLVLVGASGDQPAPNQTVASFLNKAHVRARRADGELIGDGGLAILEGFPAAAQYTAELEPGSVNVRLDLPGATSTSYALACLPNRVAMLIAVADDCGGYEIQQYLVPAKSRFGPAWMESLLANPENIRRLEIAQRYYAMGKTALEGFDERETQELLDGKWLDPLMGCLAGYSLVRYGLATDFVGHPAPSPSPDPEESAMRNMLKFFPELPDSHVLAGLCEPERRAEHYANALARGLPIFSEGARALIAWHTAEGSKMPLALASASRDLLPGSIWTAWLQRDPH